HRRGPRGIQYLNRFVERMLYDRGAVPAHQQWYPGKPVMVTVNDYSLGLYNADTGICLPDQEGKLRIYFPREDSFHSIAPARLHYHHNANALTVHKSQGSEFNNVLLNLPSKSSRVVSRELIYTDVTRARKTAAVSPRGDIKRRY